MRVTSKGQVTIPRDLRELAGIELNSEVIFSVEGGKLVLAPKNGKQEIEDRERLDRFVAAQATRGEWRSGSGREAHVSDA